MGLKVVPVLVYCVGAEKNHETSITAGSAGIQPKNDQIHCRRTGLATRWLVASLFYDAFSVTRLFSVDDMVTSE
jgi:hypothetical protein